MSFIPFPALLDPRPVWRALSGDARLLIGALFLSKATFLAIWPFLGIQLHRRFGVGVAELGSIFTAAAVAGLVVAPLGGAAADRIGRTMLLVVACLCSAASLGLFATAERQETYLAALIVLSACSGLIDPLLRTLLSDCSSSPEQRPVLFHLRYYVVNLAGAVGPLCGTWLGSGSAGDTADGALFAIAAATQLLLGVCCFRLGRRHHSNAENINAPHGDTVRGVMSQQLLALFAANALLFFAYAHMHDPLTLHLIALKVERVANLIALLYATNTLVVLLLHALIVRWLLRLPEKHAFSLAMLFMATALALVSTNTKATPSLLVAAVGLATVAEVIAMPLFMTVVDRLAPPHRRNSFFGLFTLTAAGAALAPAVAGFVISTAGGAVLFAALALLCLPVWLLGYLGLKRGAP